MSTWSDQDVVIFIDAMIEEATRLGIVGTAFKKTSWTNILSAVNARASRQFQKAQLHSKLQALREKYFSCKKQETNFGNTDATQSAFEDTLRGTNKPIKHYDRLHQLFNGVGTSKETSSESFRYSNGKETSKQAVERESCVDLLSGDDTDASSSRMSSQQSRTPRSLGSNNEVTDSNEKKRMKKRTTEERIADALEQFVANQEKRMKMHHEAEQTQLQRAIQHFLEGPGKHMTPTSRLPYINYFMSYLPGAETYNVLDKATKEAFIASLFSARPNHS